MEQELSREQAVSYAAALKRYMPGMEHSESGHDRPLPLDSGRPGRDRVGRTQLTGEGVLSGPDGPTGLPGRLETGDPQEHDEDGHLSGGKRGQSGFIFPWSITVRNTGKICTESGRMVWGR